MGKSTLKSGKQKAACIHFVGPKSKRFPLTPHASDKWMKKINGKLYHFGNWNGVVDGKMVRLPGDGSQEPEADFDKKGCTLRRPYPCEASSDGLAIKDLCNKFLNAKRRRMESVELSPRSFYEYKQATDLVIGLGWKE